MSTESIKKRLRVRKRKKQQLFHFSVQQNLLLQEDCNVICIDWSAGAKVVDGAADILSYYFRAVANTRLVGKQVSMLVVSINEAVGNSINGITGINGRTHIVGFSLGAHVAGFAGNHLKNLSRITGKCFFENSRAHLTKHLSCWMHVALF
jgi:hypothetical protein